MANTGYQCLPQWIAVDPQGITLGETARCFATLVPGAAVSEHRNGPVAVASCLTASFVAIGLFAATIGFSIGLEMGVFRMLAAVLLAGFGLVLLTRKLQTYIALAAGPAGNWAERRFGGLAASGLKGQFAIGLLILSGAERRLEALQPCRRFPSLFVAQFTHEEIEQ
jgi:hypothetical protein